jgi:hypothetical protein
MSHARSEFFDSLTAAIKDNPLAATLVGGGALWLLARNGKMRKVTDTMRSAVSAAAERSADAALSVASAFEREPPVSSSLDEPSRIGEALRNAANTASEAVSETPHTAKETFDINVSNVRDGLGNLTDLFPSYERVQSSLTAAFERQPLLIGVAGAVVGATIGGAFSMSRIENETVGTLSDELKSDLAARKDSVQESLGEASDTLKAEFSDIGAEAFDRAKQAGLDAMDAVRETVKP